MSGRGQESGQDLEVITSAGRPSSASETVPEDLANEKGESYGADYNKKMLRLAEAVLSLTPQQVKMTFSDIS